MLILLLALQIQVAAVAPPTAVDYRVVLAYPNSSDRITLRRSGSWLREDREDPESGESRTIYTDLRTGLTVEVERSRSQQALSVKRRGLRRERRLPPTGRRDSVLGESCTISRSVNEEIGQGRFGTELCETADGIPLWTRQWDAGHTGELVAARAVSLERRPIRAEEIRLPDLAAGDALRTPGGASRAVDYEVTLTPDSRYLRDTLTRRHGGLLFFENSEGDGVRRVRLSGNSGDVVYEVDAAGRPLSLEIRATPPRPRRWRLLPYRPDELVLGEQCRWSDLETDGLDGYLECRTADGIPLRTENAFHIGEPLRRTATSLSRRPLTRAAVTPSRRVFDWASWGETPDR